MEPDKPSPMKPNTAHSSLASDLVSGVEHHRKLLAQTLGLCCMVTKIDEYEKHAWWHDMLTAHRAMGTKPGRRNSRSVSLAHSLRERRQLGGMTGSPTLLKVLFLSLLCFVFVEQVYLGLDK